MKRLTLITTLALAPLLPAKEGAVECANLIYAGTKTSRCFSDEFLSTVQMSLIPDPRNDNDQPMNAPHGGATWSEDWSKRER